MFIVIRPSLYMLHLKCENIQFMKYAIFNSICTACRRFAQFTDLAKIYSPNLSTIKTYSIHESSSYIFFFDIISKSNYKYLNSFIFHIIITVSIINTLKSDKATYNIIVLNNFYDFSK